MSFEIVVHWKNMDKTPLEVKVAEAIDFNTNSQFFIFKKIVEINGINSYDEVIINRDDVSYIGIINLTEK